MWSARKEVIKLWLSKRYDGNGVGGQEKRSVLTFYIGLTF